MSTAESRTMSKPSHREGGLARPIEEQTARLPSDTFLWMAMGSIAGSLALKMMGRDKDANFVGQWVPTFLLFGVYNKIVKTHGHDADDHR
jgi:hypothetical protein